MRQTLERFLSLSSSDLKLISIVLSITEAGKRIASAIETAEVGKAGTMNVYGEEQMALDVLADKILSDNLKKNVHVGVIASEEMPDEVSIGNGEFAVAYDPLDGSSLIDVNLSVGTIFSIYQASSFIELTGNDLKCAGFFVYGPRTNLVFSCGGDVHEFTLKGDGFILSRENLRITEGKMFAPGNLRVVKERPDYLKLVEYWMEAEYTLRYSGGMVPDFNQILLKGKGIFSYPGSPSQPNGKLRLLFECAPLAFLAEKAGGSASDGKSRILDKVVERIDQRSPIFIGSKEEVKRAEEYLGSRF